MEHLPPALQQVAHRVYEGHLNFRELMSSDHNLIPHMDWEERCSKLAGLSLDQFRFTTALFLSVLVGAGIRLFRNPTVRHLYGLVTGVLLIYYPFGSGIIHMVPIGMMGYLLAALVPRSAGTLAWLIVFPYLIYLHVCNASGLAWKAGQMDFTGGAMVGVLKVLSMCVNRQDSFRKGKEDLNPYITTHMLTRLPGPLEYASYLFGLGNLLAGPWTEFREWKEFIELKGVWDPRAERPMPNPLWRGLLCVGQSFCLMGLYLALVTNGWGTDTLTGQWFLTGHWAVKVMVFEVVGMVLQLRYFFSWKVSEASLAFSGYDFAGWDEQTGDPMWGRCQNARFFGVWLTDSARMVPLNWNICTGTFLRRYVYERTARKGRKPGFRGLLITQMVSAVWHGLYPGYMIFFGFSVLWIYFSQVLYKAETHMPQALVGSLPYRAVKILWTSFILNYLASAFQLLTFKASTEALAALHYAPLYMLFVVNVLGSFIRTKRKPKSATAGDGDAGQPAQQQQQNGQANGKDHGKEQ